MISNSCNTSHFNKQSSSKGVKQRILAALGSITKCDVNPAPSTLDTRKKMFDLLSHSQTIAKNHRVSSCMKKRIDKNKNIGVMFNPVRKKAQFSNLQRCGSLWACPVCANQITMKRKQEVGQAVNAHRAKGGDVVMLTLTTPHQHDDSLLFLLNAQASARKRFWQCTAVQDILKHWGSVGHITAMEITHGKNGWHPHYHILLFIKKGVDFKKQQKQLYEKWAWACVRSGLPKPSEANGLDLQDGSHADKYITKWGIAEEMTRNVIKTGRNKGRSPFQILEDSSKGCDTSKYLFLTYLSATKGKRQLMWSRGLKDRFDIESVEDDDIVNETDNVSEEFDTLPPLVYYLLVREGKRSEYLTCVENDVLLGTLSAHNLIHQLLQAEHDFIVSKKYVKESSTTMLNSDFLHFLDSQVSLF